MVERRDRDMVGESGGPIRLDADHIPVPTARLLAMQPKARVIQLFRRSVNLDTEDGDFFSVTLSESGLGPFSIAVRGDAQPELSLKRALVNDRQDVEVLASEEELHIGRLCVNLRTARKWDPRLAQGQLKEVDSWAAATCILDDLKRYAPVDSLPFAYASDGDSWIGVRTRQAWSKIRQAVESDEPEGCGAGAYLVAGAGIGLTPAGDDFLMGVLLALWLAMEAPYPYVDSMLEGTTDRTGRLPRAFLRAAARGEAGQAWHSLAWAIVQGDAPRIRLAARVVLSAGHTSGADALFGFAMALGLVGSRMEVGAQPDSSLKAE